MTWPGSAASARQTIYEWKAKHGGLDVSEAQRLRSLDDENSRPQAPGGGPQPGQGDAEGGDRKKRPQLVDRRTDTNWLRSQYAASEHRVCGLMSIAVSSYRYRSRRSDESLRKQVFSPPE
jgi:hypothetical protein